MKNLTFLQQTKHYVKLDGEISPEFNFCPSRCERDLICAWTLIVCLAVRIVFGLLILLLLPCR